MITDMVYIKPSASSLTAMSRALGAKKATALNLFTQILPRRLKKKKKDEKDWRSKPTKNQKANKKIHLILPLKLVPDVNTKKFIFSNSASKL